MISELPKTQKCTSCLQYKELKYFGKDSRGKYGRKRQCNNCKRKESSLYRSKNKNVSSHKAYYLLKNMCKKHEVMKLNYLPEFTVDEVIDIMENGVCAVTNTKFRLKNNTNYRSNPYMASPDRIDTSLGYTKNNVRWVCVWVNLCRSHYTIKDFMKFIKDIKKC